MRLLHLPANEYRRERWRNEAGWTREIHRHPEGTAEWQWRVSIAEIEHDAAFSLLPGIDRELMLLSGNGLRLRFDDGECVELNPPHDRHRFAGERALTGELVDGTTHDFNLMWRRDRIRTETWHREGQLQRMDRVFSRDQPTRRYVQHAVSEAAGDVRRWIEDGAAVYVCGSLEGMAPAVDEALASIIGRDALDAMAAEGRYRRDVY